MEYRVVEVVREREERMHDPDGSVPVEDPSRTVSVLSLSHHRHLHGAGHQLQQQLE